MIIGPFQGRHMLGFGSHLHRQRYLVNQVVMETTCGGVKWISRCLNIEQLRLINLHYIKACAPEQGGIVKR